MSDELSGKLIADKYRVGELIREGDAGDLYHGRHEIMDRPVTLRILPQALGIDQRWQKRFIEESRAASTIGRHPNVLQLNDFGTDQKQISYSVFEPIEGATLAEQSGAALAESRAIEIAKAVAAGVGAAHEKGIIHGQLSPKNIFVNGDDVKVYGFGGDRLNTGREADIRYLAPEQIGKFSAADERSDIYSLGVLLYEMVSGVDPYDGADSTEIKAKQENEPPPPLSAFRKDLNSEIEPIILSAMALDPERRYQTMSQFAEDLDLLGSRLGVPAAESADAGNLKPPAWRTVAIVAAGVILLAGALIYATRSRQTDVTASLQADAGSLPVQPIGAATGIQEDALAKLPAEMTPEEIAAAQAAATGAALGVGPYSTGPLAGSTAPTGADTYNPWASGGQPPPGAPAYVPPSGTASGAVNPNSPFTSDNPSGTTIIRKNVLTGECTDFNTGTPVPCPSANDPNARPVAPPRGSANANTAPKPTPKPAATPPANTAKPAANTATKKPGGDAPEEN